MKITGDEEGIQAINYLIDHMLKTSGIKSLQFVNSIIGNIELKKKRKSKKVNKNG